MLDQQMVQIAVEAEATNIPTGIEIDVEGMAIGASVHAGDLSLPAGSTLAVDAELLVLHVIAAPTAEQMEAGLGIEAEEGAAAVEDEPAPVPDAPGAAAAGAAS
jgi:large subunit ribosomal protein L25